MPAEATRSVLHFNHFPLTVAVLSIIAFVSFSNIWGHDKPHVIGFRGPLAGDRWEPESNGTTRHMLHRRLDPYQCTKDIPCHNVACCGSFFGGDVGTCGFGDTFCGSDCASQCDAKPECGPDADPPGKTCPLNVCCSKYGFCGTTSEFCDTSQGCTSNCGTPSIPPGKSSKDVTSKVIGYYEAWSARRECYPFPPAAIPIEGLTHLNFAFGYIDPSSFEIVPMDSLTPASLFTQTADVRTFKSGLSDLQVYISLGGWTFSDNGTDTQPVFGDIASTEANRQKFAYNLIDFMKKYGFDGVDIDWEYPGAGDRGGKEADTGNYVLLMKTLRETFDNSAHGPYGLTFTIPSSYWYLRWFDVPGMLKYADWTNMMTYDLHGVWDKENPIGDIVQAHTNLTEIKQSMDLLWRNNVSPEKVVMGLGFYGRSFTLKKSTCTSPGCTFAGAAEAGACTDNAGTLAYFEIQDIISGKDPKVTHDEDAAVKYFTFSNDQWVSFDDDETFKQKVDWANDVGLGGLMIWSIDQDDKQFSALTGLLGRSLQSYSSLLQRAVVTDAGKWTSLNGQKCIMTDCALPPSCPAGYGMAPNGGGFDDTCKGSKFKIICCPLNKMPSSCLWRGGESSVGRPSCHGQCHTGEVTLFHSRHATKNCLRPGFQAFCCEAETWSRQIDACKWSSCGTKCASGTTQVAQRLGQCWFGGAQNLCCPSDASFQNCHWVGKGTCDDNECDDNDVQLATDTYGDSAGSCVGNSRKKVLCCDSPKNLSPYLPVALDKVFPTPPPAEDYPQFDLQNLGGDDIISTELNVNTFGLVIIVGPDTAVQSLRRRDGSDLHVLDCENVQTKGPSRVRFVCPAESWNSTCDKIHLGGVGGTVLRMPEGCGPGSYAVLHDVRPSTNRTVPYNIARRTGTDARVLDAELSFDFSRVKRDSGDIYIRIDYSNSMGYWDSIVQGDPVTSKKKRAATPLDKRFYSAAASDWKKKFDDIRNAGKSQYPQPPYILGQGSLKKSNFDTLLSGESPEKCSTTDDDGFLKADISGSLLETLEFGYTFVGTISPTFQMVEANGYYDTSFQMTGALNFNGKGYLSVPAGMSPANLFNSPVSAWRFSHPGICDFGPQVNIEVQMTGEGDIDGDFSANFIIGNDGTVTDSLPTSLGAHLGGVSNSLLDNPFSGKVTLPSSSSSKRRRASASDGTVLALRFFTNSQMKLDLDFYGTKEVAAGVEFNQTIDSYLRINRQSDGSPRIAFSNQVGTRESFTRGDLPWGDDDIQSVVGYGNALVLHEGAETPAVRDAPTMNGYALFGGHDLMSCSNSDGGGSSLQDCLCISQMDQFDRTLDFDPETGEAYDFVQRRKRRSSVSMSGLHAFDPTLDLDPETGAPYDESLFHDLDARAITYGAPVDYTVHPPSGNNWAITMNRYPNGQDGQSLLQANPNAGRYGAEDCHDCGNIAISSDSDDPEMRVVTEHIHERQTEPRAQEFMMTGTARLGDGTLVESEYRDDPVPESYLDQNSYLWQPYSQWDPNGPYTANGRPIDEITNAYGSDLNPDVLANADSVLNGYKARVWVGHQTMSDTTWNGNGFNIADHTLTEQALTAIRTTIQVTSYLNEDQINRNWATVVNNVIDIYGRYQERVLAVDGTEIHPREMYQEYIAYVVVPDIENAENWIQRRLGQLQELWEPLQGQNGWADPILKEIRALNGLVNNLLLDTTALNLF